MGLLSWFKGTTKPETKPETKEATEIPGMNGAVQVPRAAANGTVLEFGKAGTDNLTLAGYCPVSEEVEPCRWQLVSAEDSHAPQFRVVF